MQRLLSAVKGYVPMELHSQKHYYGLWSNKSAIFEQSEPEQTSSPRTLQLQKGRKRISKRAKESECARRLSLLFLHHEVLEKMLSLKQASLRKGEGILSLALKVISKETLDKVQDLSDDNSYGRRYMLLLEESGPGDLLELGEGVSTM